MCYGLLALPRQPEYQKYFVGMWEHGSWKDALLKILLYAVCCVAPRILMMALDKHVVDDLVGSYLLSCGSMTLLGLGLSWAVPMGLLKCDAIRLLPVGSYQQIE